MKQTFVKITSKRLIMAGIFTTLTFATLNQAKAGNNTYRDSSNSAIEYVGTTDNSILFNVKFDNTTGSKFNLIIQNEDGEVLYQHEYSDKNFNKKIVLVKEQGDAKLTFIIRDAKTDLKQSFNISTTARIVEDVTVTKAK